MAWNHTDALFVVVIALIIALGVLVILITYQDQSNIHLKNDKIYACPNGDWAGTTAQMKMTVGGEGFRRFYCPIDGAYIGWQSSADPYPIGQEG